MTKKMKLSIGILIGLLILTALAITDYYFHNFHTVIPNEVFRSRQLSQQQFAAVIKEHHIKSIINLRGAHPKDTWYKNELSVSQKNNVAHYDIPLKSDILPSAVQFSRLVHILETAPKPILVHCESGVDRSGLASAISLILANSSLKKAQTQVSWDYFVLNHKSVGKQFLRHYKKWLAENQLTTSRKNFLRWVNVYEPFH